MYMEDILEQQNQEQSQPPEQSPKSKKGLIITIIILVVLIFSGGAFAAYYFELFPSTQISTEKINKQDVEVSENDSIETTNNTDEDNDGLTYDEEISLGTDPSNPDTDGDGFNDGDEVEAGYSPLEKEESNEDVEVIVEDSPKPAHEPSYINTTITTLEPVNQLRFNVEFLSEDGGGLLTVYFDGDLVDEIDQRFVPQYLEREVAIGGNSGVVEPGEHNLSIRLDGFGDEDAGVELTNVEVGLLTVVPTQNQDDSLTISNIRAVQFNAISYYEKLGNNSYEGFCEYDNESGEVGMKIVGLDPLSYACLASDSTFMAETQLSNGNYYCVDSALFYGELSGSSIRDKANGICYQN